MKKSIKLLSLMLALVLMMFCVACGGNGDANNDGSNADADAKKPTVVVGYTIYEPMNYLDAEGKLIGYDTDLAKKVFGNLGYEVIFKEINWDNKYTDLNSGVIDCIWNGFTCNTADDDGILRADKVDFSYNYMENRQVIVIKNGTAIATAADLSGKIASAESGSAGESYAKGFDGIVFKGVIKQTDSLMEVNAGTADFAVVDEQLAKSYCGQGDYANLTIVETLSSDLEYYAIGFKKGSKLTAKVNEQLEKCGADGTIDALIKAYPKCANTAIKDFSDQKAPVDEK